MSKAELKKFANVHLKHVPGRELSLIYGLMKGVLAATDTVPAGAEAVVPFGGAEIDLGRRIVRRDGRRVHLTAREYELLACLARHPGRVLTHATLLRDVWGPAYIDETHYLRVHMANLRKKLEADAASPRHLLTESGVGYKLEPGR